MSERVDARQAQLDAAKKRARERPPKPVSVEGPDWERVSLDDAITMIEVFMWESGARYGFSTSADGQAIMARVAVPKDSDIADFAGLVSFVFGSSLDHAVRKASQLHNGDYDAFWKKDTYAK